MTENKFRSTTIYGKLKCIDSTDGKILSDISCSRNITVKKDIILGEETYDSSGNNIVSTNGNIIFTYNKILYTIPISKLSYLNLLTSDIQTQINSIASSSSSSSGGSGSGSGGALLSSNNIFTGLNSFNNFVSQNIGGYNTQYGTNSLTHNTTGSRNSAFGYDALKSNTEGYYNCAIGNVTLSANTTGHHCVAIGNSSQILNTTGSANTSIGTDSLTANITGIFNTCVGNSSGYSITGNFNTCLGHGTDVLNSSNYSTAVGVYAKCTSSNQIVLGTSNETTYIPGNLTANGNINFTGGVFSYGNHFYVQGCEGIFNNGLRVLNDGLYINQGDLTVYGGKINDVSREVFDYIKNLNSDAQTQLNSISTSVSNIFTQDNTYFGLNHFTKKCVISSDDLSLSVIGDTELQNTYINGDCVIGNTLSNTLSVNSSSVFQNNVRFTLTLNDVSVLTFNYIKNITSDVQTQLNNKASLTLSNVFKGINNTFNNGLSVLNGGAYITQGDLTVYGGNILFNNFIGGISKTVFNYLSGATSNIQNQLNTLFSLTPPGTIIMNVSTSTALSGYLSCDGSEVSKAIYANLYNAIQDIYGAPSNPANFKLPNFQGLFLRGTGSQNFNGQTYIGSSIGPIVPDTLREQSGLDFTTSLNTTRVEVSPSYGGGMSVIGSLSWTNISHIGNGNNTAPIHSCVRYYIKH